MEVLTGPLQLALAALSFITALSFLVSYIKNKHLLQLKLFIFFISTTAIAASFAVPFFIEPYEPLYASAGAITALLFTLLTVIIAFEVPYYPVHTRLYKYRNVIKNVIAFIGLGFISFSLINPPLPVIDNSGLVFWGIHPITAWGFGFVVLLASILWSFLHYKSGKMTPRLNILTRIKIFILSIDGIMWGAAALIYFTANNVAAITVAFTLMLTSFLATAIVFWASKYV